MKKKIAFFSYNLDIGGIERAIINYVNLIDYQKYDVTLFLEKKEGAYINDVNSKIKIIAFNPSNLSNIIFRKIHNFIKLLYFIIKYYHRFFFAACFKSTSRAGSLIVPYISKNNAFYFHGNYWNNEKEAKTFIKQYHVLKYQKLVFVSEALKKEYLKVISSHQLLFVKSNQIDYKEIIKKNKKKTFSTSKITFLNVGRHSEEEKNITMLLKTLKRLKDEKYSFKLWLLGSGPDTNYYRELVNNLNLSNEIEFLGFSNNVYPYIKSCDALLLTSKKEGNPVVFNEAKVLGKTVITTDVSDARIDLNGFGIVTENNEEAFYQGLKSYLNNGFKIYQQFDGKKYNEEIITKVYEMIEKR